MNNHNDSNGHKQQTIKRRRKKNCIGKRRTTNRQTKEKKTNRHARNWIRIQEKNEVLSPACHFFLTVLLASMVPCLFQIQTDLDLCSSCAHLTLDWNDQMNRMREFNSLSVSMTKPRMDPNGSVSISVELIFWDLCYTSMELVPSQMIPVRWFFCFYFLYIWSSDLRWWNEDESLIITFG